MTDTITLPRSVVEQALEALFMYKPMITGLTFQHGLDAMQALRAALEQPQVEQPVAVVTGFYGGFPTIRPLEPATVLPAGMALYTHPQNLNCKSTQHRLATLWGYEKPQPQVEQEPVAFIQVNRHGEQELVWDKDEDLDGHFYDYKPLYPHPQPPRQPQIEKRVAWLPLDGRGGYTSPEPQVEQEPDAFYEWWHMRPSLTRLQAWLLWKDEQKQLNRAHGIGGEE